jgi:hypothetical protein
MEKFGIEIIDPSGKEPIRAFIADDDALWRWINIPSVRGEKGDVITSVPEGYAVVKGAVVKADSVTGPVVTSVVLNQQIRSAQKANMVAKALSETTREQFSKEGIPQGRIIAVIPA